MPEYSNSQLGKFESCPLQYGFVYVDRIKRPEEGVEALKIKIMSLILTYG